MIEVIILFLLALIWIVFASITDIKTREIPNWISFSLVIFALGFRFFFSLFNDDFGFFYQGLIGLLIFFAIGNIFYYSRIFAGGDAKLMIALGSVLPFTDIFSYNLRIFVIFIFLFLFIGSFYGIITAIYLSFRKYKEFNKAFKTNLKKEKNKIFIVMIFSLLIILFGFLESIFLIVGFILLIMPYLYIYARTVDGICMIRETKTNVLTEGDWLYKSVKVGKKIIKPNWEGLNREEIKLIRKKYKKIKIKQGIVFVPVFLISLLILFYLWNTGLWNSFW